MSTNFVSNCSYWRNETLTKRPTYWYCYTVYFREKLVCIRISLKKYIGYIFNKPISVKVMARGRIDNEPLRPPVMTHFSDTYHHAPICQIELNCFLHVISWTWLLPHSSLIPAIHLTLARTYGQSQNGHEECYTCVRRCFHICILIIIYLLLDIFR